MNKITYDRFLDKVHGCWYGKCLGGAAGAPVEGIKNIIDVGDFTEIFNPDLPNDDLDLQLLWLDVIERKGAEITSCDLADAWIEKCWYPFSEYGYFMKNYMRGIKPPYSGIINNPFFMEGMGCPIRSEIWGIINAGNPKQAAEYAYIDACLDHAENAVYAEQFLAAVESLAFFESDIRTLIDLGMEYIPKDCRLAECFGAVIREFESGADWESARRAVLNRFGHPDFTNSVQNMGIILIALLYGGGDMRKTINIALRCGYDTDCTCASAASVVGIISGYNALGELKSLINDYFICGIDVKRPSDSIKRLAEDCCAAAMNTPNSLLCVTDRENRSGSVSLKCEYPTKERIEVAKRSVEPIRWKIYGPYYDQLHKEMNPEYPSPHGEGSVLPDIVCMVNNEAFLDRDYPKGDLACTVEAYEDMIELDNYITMQGQYACLAETTVYSDREQTVWAVIGNNDAFSMSVNGETVLAADEMRLWTPYNNFCLIRLNAGENRIALKLLKRGEVFRFSIGFRCYTGEHWHRSKWCTDLKYSKQ